MVVDSTFRKKNKKDVAEAMPTTACSRYVILIVLFCFQSVQLKRSSALREDSKPYYSKECKEATPRQIQYYR